MKKNVAGQICCAQIISKTDGSAVTTGTTLVYVLGDGAVQVLGEGTGSPSGQAVHEGQGVWSYTPTQADTNYDNVVFTFVNSAAINASIQIYTSFPQTGDNYARLGAPAGASVSADVAAVKAVLPSALVSGRIDASVGAMAANVLTATAIAADAITDAKVASDVTIASVTGAVGSVTGAVGSVTARVTANTDQLAGQTVTAAAGVTFPTSVASPTNITAGTITTATNLTNAPTAGDFTATMKTSIGTAVAASAVASVTGNVTGSVGSVSGLTASDVGAIKVVTDKVGSTLQDTGASPTSYQFTTTALVNAPTGSGASAADIADAVWDEATSGHAIAGSTGKALTDAGSAGNPWSTTIEGSYTAEDILRILVAVAAGKTTINGTTVTFRDITDATNIVVAAMSASERQTVTLSP